MKTNKLTFFLIVMAVIITKDVCYSNAQTLVKDRIKNLLSRGILLIIIMFTFLNSDCINAQVIFEHEVDSLDLDTGFKVVWLNQNESKYYFVDTLNNSFSLYNMDFTPFVLNISVPEPFNSAQYGFQVLYITYTLFDCDSSNIEYVYTAPFDGDKPFRVMRIDGSVIFQRDSINSTYCFGCRGGSDDIRPIVNTSSGTKLFLQTFKLGYSQIFIYSLCGSLPTKTTEMSVLSEEGISLNLFPNPSTGIVNLDIQVPANLKTAELDFLIFNNYGQILKVSKIKNKDLHAIDVSYFQNGIYFYKIISKNNSYHVGKFIINH